MTEIEAMFKHLGLKHYESKAMITLFSYGKNTAEQITSLSGIPLPRVYDTMNGLAKRGFVSVSKTRPEMFKAIDPKRLLSLLEEEETKKTNKKLKEMSSIMPQLLKHIKLVDNGHTDIEDDIIAVIKRRVNIRKDREEFHMLAKKEILVFSGDMSWVRHVEDLVKDAIKRNVDYKIIYCKNNKDSITNANKFKKLGAKAKYFKDTAELRCLVFDRKAVSVIIKKYKVSGDFEYSIVNIHNSIIADVFARHFDSVWKQAK